MLQTQSMDTVSADEPERTGSSSTGDVTHLRQVTRQQWRSGIAAWLGWTFDGLDMHLYTLVAAPFVAQLLGAGGKLVIEQTDLLVPESSGKFRLGYPAKTSVGPPS